MMPGNEDNMDESGGSPGALRTAREKIGLNKKEAAARLGVSYSAYPNWESGRSRPDEGYETIIRCLRTGATVPSKRRYGDEAGDPIYDTPASAGDGWTELTEQPVGRMPPSQSLSSAGREVFWMPVVGDSMGERYRKHSLVPVAKFNDPLTDFSTDDVYVIRLEGAVQIKRLQRLAGQRVRIISDNDAYPDQEIQLDEGIDFQVLGRVLV